MTVQHAQHAPLCGHTRKCIGQEPGGHAVTEGFETAELVYMAGIHVRTFHPHVWFNRNNTK